MNRLFVAMTTLLVAIGGYFAYIYKTYMPDYQSWYTETPQTTMQSPEFFSLPTFIGLLIGFYAMGFVFGWLPIPAGYDRGKIRWVMVCGTGGHAEDVYWCDKGFQMSHPRDRGESQ